jgi:hypothetical protein
MVWINRGDVIELRGRGCYCGEILGVGKGGLIKTEGGGRVAIAMRSADFTATKRDLTYKNECTVQMGTAIYAYQYLVA